MTMYCLWQYEDLVSDHITVALRPSVNCGTVSVYWQGQCCVWSISPGKKGELSITVVEYYCNLLSTFFPKRLKVGNLAQRCTAPGKQDKVSDSILVAKFIKHTPTPTQTRHLPAVETQQTQSNATPNPQL